MKLNFFDNSAFVGKFIGSLLALIILATNIFAQTSPPNAPVRPVTDDYFGQKIVDPYR